MSRPVSPPAVHHVFACKSNVGDWMSARAIQALLRPLRVVEHLCDEPFVPGTLERLSRLDDGAVVVIGGGGLFMDYFEPFWAGLAELEPELQLCLWGVGYCDLKERPSRTSHDSLERVLARASLCVVRDELTRSYLGNGLDGPVPCPTLTAVAPAGRRPLALHSFDYAVLDEQRYRAVREMVSQYAEEHRLDCAETNNLIRDGSESELAAVLDLYRAEIVVSSRLHGCILALASGAKLVAVAGDRKVDAFMAAAGLGDWVVDLDSLDRLPELLARLAAQPGAAAFVARATAENRRVAEAVRSLATR